MASLAAWPSFEDTGCVISPPKRVALKVATAWVTDCTVVLEGQRILARYTLYGMGWESRK